MPSGLEILQETIEACKAVGDGLGSQEGVSEEWEPAVAQLVEALDGLTSSFFFKTMPSIPAARACQRDVAALKALVDQGDLSGFSRGLENVQKAVAILADKATMRGITLT